MGVSRPPTSAAGPRSLVWATDIDVLPAGKVIERRDGYLAVRSPGNPSHYWGNMLLFDDPPDAGDGRRWERLFQTEFGSDQQVRHRAFAWDRSDGVVGLAREEFEPSGYALEETVGLIASPGQLRPHPRENRVVHIRALGAGAGADADLWEQVAELQVATRDERYEEHAHRVFVRRRLDELRTLFAAGRGAWFVALDRGKEQVLGSCGVVATGERARFQSVDTAPAHRRRGICSRLLVEAAVQTAERHSTRRFVIVADPAYHALALYASLGFRAVERVAGVCRLPGAAYGS
jgi:ribosomal protein S18 acetylase RimI-like enzyme